MIGNHCARLHGRASSWPRQFKATVNGTRKRYWAPMEVSDEFFEYPEDTFEMRL